MTRGHIDGIDELIQRFGSIKPESDYGIQAPQPEKDDYEEPFYPYPDSGRMSGCLHVNTQRRFEELSQKLQGMYRRTKESILLDPNFTGRPVTFKEFFNDIPVLSLEDLNGGTGTLQRDDFLSWREQDHNDLDPPSDGLLVKSWGVHISDSLVQSFSSTIQLPLIAAVAVAEPHLSAIPQSIYTTDVALATTDLTSIPTSGTTHVEESAQRWLNPGLNWKASKTEDAFSRKKALRSRARQAQHQSPHYAKDKSRSTSIDPFMTVPLQQPGFLSVNTFYAISPAEKHAGLHARSAQFPSEGLHLSPPNTISPDDISVGVSAIEFNQVPGVWFALTSNTQPPLSASEFSSSSSSNQSNSPASAYSPTESSKSPHSPLDILNELWIKTSSSYSCLVEPVTVNTAIMHDFDPRITFANGGAFDPPFNGTHLNQPLPGTGYPDNMQTFSTVTRLTCGVDGCLERFADENSLSRHRKQDAFHNPAAVLCSRCDSTLSRTDAWKRHTENNVCEHRNHFNKFRLQTPSHVASVSQELFTSSRTSVSSSTRTEPATNGDSFTSQSILHAGSQHRRNAGPEATVTTAGRALVSLDLQPPALHESPAEVVQPSDSLTLQMAPPVTSPSKRARAKLVGTQKKKNRPLNHLDLFDGIVCGLDGCEEVIARHDDLNRHRKTAMFHNPKPKICPQCRSKFARQDSLNRHLERNACGKRRTPLDKAAEADAAAAKEKGREG
ncbi:hypothetical protein DXG03_007314 [Asterophora parasitica]|uniref:C2H2-type domain-containing protein n=1 Tax=Asterophora parasitica TaxID=117018 RepID=A0A9P7G4N1_9AGAR|nr:hypothetical protein DXG03_007314 [Asterophora parasitica]